MGENGGVLTCPWSQISGLSVAVIHSEYMSHSTYRQVVLSANGPTAPSNWPSVQARPWHLTSGCTWRSRARPRRSGSVSFGFLSLSLCGEALDHHKGEESFVRQMQCDLSPIGCSHNGIMLISVYRQRRVPMDLDKPLETKENCRSR